MPAVLCQIDGYDPVGATTFTIYASSVNDERVCHINGQTWWPMLAIPPQLLYDLVDAAFSGWIGTPSSPMTLAVEPWPNLPRYNFTDARVQIWTGEPGAAWGSFTQRFDGRCTAQPKIAAGMAALTIAVDDRWLDTPLLTLYAGTTGAEGTAAMKGKVKPLALGAPRFVPAELIDPTNIVYQLSSYGLIEDVEVAFERVLRFGASAGDYATYAALIAASIPAGAWATAKAVGMVRHGAPPVPGGRFCYHVKGDKAGPDAWVRLPGQIIKRIALLAGGTGRFLEASVDALDAARPWNVSWYLNQQVTAREAIQRIAASVNAAAGVSWMGQLFVAALPTLPGSASATLDNNGVTLPPVASIEQIEIDPPFWRMSIKTEITWDVHQYSDVAFTAILVDRGAYVSTDTYREGHIVQNQNISWIYINATPGSGNAPPTLPTASNSWWKALSPTRITTDNNVLNIEEKRTSLLPNLTELAARYALVTARASAQGVSITAAANARSAAQTYLNTLAPAFNDTQQDTTLAANLATDMSLWTDAGAALTTSGIYTVLTDNDAAASESRFAAFACTPSANYSFAFVVKKDAVAGATRAPAFRLLTFNGTSKAAVIQIDTATGAFTTSGTPLDAGVADLDDETWLAWVSMTMPGDTTSGGVQVWPAYGPYGSNVNATQGSVSVLAPALVLGAFNQLGRPAMKWLLRDYGGKLDALDKAISEADVVAAAASISGQQDIVIAYNADGTAKVSELTRNETMKLVRGGVTVTTGLTWTYSVISGTVSGFDNTSGAQSIAGAGAVSYPVTSLGTDEAKVQLKCVDANGVTFVMPIRVSKAVDLGGSGSGGGTFASGGISFSTSSTSYGAAAVTLRCKAGTGGQVALATAGLSFVRDFAANTLRHGFGKWQWRVLAGSYADVTTEIKSSPGASNSSPEGIPEQSPGAMACSMTKTGLTSGTEYEFQLLLRNETASVTLDFSGTGTATGS